MKKRWLIAVKEAKMAASKTQIGDSSDEREYERYMVKG